MRPRVIYNRGMKFSTIFFDLDDTLYPPETNLWRAIKLRMNDYMRERMHIPEQQIPELREKYYQQYGTTMRGLQAHHQIDTDDFLAYVHNLPLAEFLSPDPVQREIIAALPARRVIFTNADVHHAQRVLAALNLSDLFPVLVDVNAVAPYCKPMPESFEIAMRAAGETDPSRCVMIDDLKRTTRAARAAGMFSLLYGNESPNSDAHASFTNWRDLPQILEEL